MGSRCLGGRRRGLHQAIGYIDRLPELEKHWPTEPAIDLPAGELHPRVWDAAKGLWASEHWGEAVEAAIKVVNAQLQRWLGRRDVSGTDLVRQAFSRHPPKVGEPRLRVQGPVSDDTKRSVQEGAMHLGEAIFIYWRNVLAHEPRSLDRQQAAEALGALSAFARVVDEAALEKADSSPAG